MPIQENQYDANGLAQLAGNRAASLNLPLHAVDVGYQGLLERSKLQEQYQGLQTQLQEQQLRNQGLFGVQQLSNQGQLAQTQLQGQNQLANTALTGQNQLANTKQEGVNTLANTGAMVQGYYQPLVQNQTQQIQNEAQAAQLQHQVGMAQAAAAQTGANANLMQAQTDNQWKDLQARIEMNRYQLQQRGAAGASFAIALNTAQGDPEKQQQIMQHYLPIYVQEGMISAQEAQAMQQAGPQGALMMAQLDVLKTGMAQDAKNAGIPSILPGSQAIYGNLPATPQQSNIQSAQQQTIESNNILSHFNPDIFTYSGQAQAAAGNVIGKLPEGLQNLIPGAQDAKNMDDAQKAFSSNALSQTMSILQNQKGVRLNKMTLDALSPLVPKIGEDSPGTAFTKEVTMTQRAQRAEQYADQLVKQGVNPNSNQYQQQINQFIQTDNTPGQLTFTIPGTHNKTNVNFDTIKSFASDNKMSVPDAIKFIMANP